jgi:hypothetical protein
MASSNSNILEYINLTDSESIKFERDVSLNAVHMHDSNISFAVIDLYFGQIRQSLPTTSGVSVLVVLKGI